MKNYYDDLEVNKNASKEVIEKAYKVLAKKYHPDSTNNTDKRLSEERFKVISEAYNTLSDDEKRKEYDKELEESSPTISYEEYEYVLNKNKDLEDEINYLYSRLNGSSTTSSNSIFTDTPRGYYNRFTDSFVNPRSSSGSSYTTRRTARSSDVDTEDDNYYEDTKSAKRTFYYSDTGKPASAFNYYVYRIKSVFSNFFFAILVFIIVLLVIRGALLLTFGNKSNTNTNANKSTDANTTDTNRTTITNTTPGIYTNAINPEERLSPEEKELTNQILNNDNPLQEIMNWLSTSNRNLIE